MDDATDPPLRPEVARTRTSIVLFGGAIVALGLWSAVRGDVSGGVLLAGGAVAVMAWSWPTRGPHLSEAEATATARPGDLVVYWRPGCPYCARLALVSRFRSWPAGTKRIRVNIWRDPDAAATVRLLRDGSETVPTVVGAGGELVEAAPRAMAAYAAAHSGGADTAPGSR